MSNVSKFLTITIFLLTAWSCKQQNVEPNNKALTDIRVSPEALTFEAGEQKQLTTELLPAGIGSVILSWSSDKANVASVSSSGLVTGRAHGKAVITVRSSNISKTVSVTVNPEPFKMTIGSTKYDIDTLEYQEIASGVKWFKFSVPTFTNGFGTFGNGLVVNGAVQNKPSDGLERAVANGIMVTTKK